MEANNVGIRKKPVESNMYYCKSRYYVPEWCRWLNGDNIAYLDLEDIDGMNLFSYCGNNPLTNIDEEGNFFGIGFAIAFGLAALFAATSVTMMTKPEVSQEIVSAIDDSLQFIGESIKSTIQMNTLPWIMTFVALDNVLMSKKKNPNPYKRPDRKKQGREEGNKATRTIGNQEAITEIPEKEKNTHPEEITESSSKQF